MDTQTRGLMDTQTNSTNWVLGTLLSFYIIQIHYCFYFLDALFIRFDPPASWTILLLQLYLFFSITICKNIIYKNY